MSSKWKLVVAFVAAAGTSERAAAGAGSATATAASAVAATSARMRPGKEVRRRRA
jgi:hypothetical protein